MFVIIDWEGVVNADGCRCLKRDLKLLIGGSSFLELVNAGDPIYKWKAAGVVANRSDRMGPWLINDRNS